MNLVTNTICTVENAKRSPTKGISVPAEMISVHPAMISVSTEAISANLKMISANADKTSARLKVPSANAERVSTVTTLTSAVGGSWTPASRIEMISRQTARTRCHRPIRSAVVSLMTACLVTAAHADPVPILNPSFELTPPAPTLALEQSTSGCGTSVPVRNAGGSPAGFDVNKVGWVSSTNRAGVLRPGSASYPNGVADGLNCAWSEPAVISQVLTSERQPNVKYELTVAIGNRATQPQGGFRISLWAAGVLLAEATGTLPPQGTFGPRSAVHYSPNQVPPGQNLEIRLQAIGGPSDQANFDAVQLDASPFVCAAIGEHPSAISTCPTGSATFSITSAGSGPLTYQWQHEFPAGVWFDIDEGVNVNMATATGIATPTLHLADLGPIAPGAYRCVVSNACGVVTSDEAVLTICVADTDDGTGSGACDSGVGIEDLLYYLTVYDAGTSRADVDDGTGTGTPDGGVGIEDLLYYLQRYDAGC